MSQSWRRLCGSSPVVGSSRKRILGFPTSAVATARRCRCPPESLPTTGIGLLGELQFVEHFVGGARLAVEAGEQFNGFADGQLLREPRLLQRDSQPLAHFALILLPGVTKNRDLAGSGIEQPFEDFDGGGLPCPVRTEEPEALSGLNLQSSGRERLRLFRRRSCAGRGIEWQRAREDSNVSTTRFCQPRRLWPRCKPAPKVPVLV